MINTEILELLKEGYSPSELCDNRVFNPPFKISEVFETILFLKINFPTRQNVTIK